MPSLLLGRSKPRPFKTQLQMTHWTLFLLLLSKASWFGYASLLFTWHEMFISFPHLCSSFSFWFECPLNPLHLPIFLNLPTSLLHPWESTVLYYYLFSPPKMVCFFIIQLASHLCPSGLLHWPWSIPFGIIFSSVLLSRPISNPATSLWPPSWKSSGI